MAVVYRNLGRYSEAKEYHEKALIIRKEIYGDQLALTERTFRTLKKVDRGKRAQTVVRIII